MNFLKFAVEIGDFFHSFSTIFVKKWETFRPLSTRH